MNERMTASMTVWERIPATDQMEIITRAAKRVAYLAGAFGVSLTPDELIGQTWIGTVERLDADRLSKAVGISGVAVHKRVTRMRKSLSEAIA